MDVDAVLREIGQFGPFQRRNYVIMSLAWIPSAFATLSFVFTNAEPDWHCVKHCVNGTGPGCTTGYVANCSSVYDAWKKSHEAGAFCSLPDRAFAFDAPPSHRVNIEFGLTCDKSWVSSFLTSAFFLGYFFGSGIFGYLTDRWGRRRVVPVAGSLFALSVLMSAFVNTAWLYVCCQFVIGMGVGGFGIAAFILGNEFVGPSYRSATGPRAPRRRSHTPLPDAPSPSPLAGRRHQRERILFSRRDHLGGCSLLHPGMAGSGHLHRCLRRALPLLPAVHAGIAALACRGGQDQGGDQGCAAPSTAAWTHPLTAPRLRLIPPVMHFIARSNGKSMPMEKIRDIGDEEEEPSGTAPYSAGSTPVVEDRVWDPNVSADDGGSKSSSSDGGDADDVNRVSVRELFAHKELRKRTLLMMRAWPPPSPRAHAGA